MICDAECRVLDIVARWPGSTHDSRILQNSCIFSQFEQGKYQQKFLLGDGGYPSKSYLLTPLQNPASDAETRYNVAHARARNVIEKFFGMWKRKFSILGQDSRIRVKIETAMTLIVACAVIHNLAKSEGEPDEGVELDDDSFDQTEGHGEKGATSVRSTIISQYFKRTS